jgi:trehalose 6-phosphate synthase
MTPRPTAPLVIASNRGPVDFVLADGEIVRRPGAGGLINVLGPVLAGGEGVWIAAARTEGDRAMARRAAGVPVPVDIPEGRVAVRALEFAPETYQAYYEAIGTDILWFLHHHLLESIPDGAQLRSNWQAYEQVNDRFAAACAEVAAPGAVVLVQDYHLTTAPARLRARRRDLRIAHFTMTPWADPDRFHALPAPIARELVEGMLGADVVAFLATRWADAFLRCCAELGLEVDLVGRRVRSGDREAAVRVYPVGVDVAALRERLGHPRVRAEIGRLDAELGERQLIARVERMEPAKNTVRGVEAYGALLAARPDLAGRVVHHVLAYTSRATLPGYRRYAEEAHAAVRAVNDRFGTPGWTPVVLTTENDFDHGLALMARADVLVVNPVRDGMNLVAKEGAAVNDRGLALVLSRDAGAAEELGEAALLVDPSDTLALTTAIAAGLELPAAQRRAQARRLRDRGGALPPRLWLSAVLADLSRSASTLVE